MDRFNVNDLIARVLADTGTTLLPSVLVDLTGGVSAHSDRFLSPEEVVPSLPLAGGGRDSHAGELPGIENPDEAA